MSDKDTQVTKDWRHILREKTPDIITDNAPRVVAGFKILGAGSMLFDKNPLSKLAGGINIIGHVTLVAFGRKKNETEKESLRAHSRENDLAHSSNPLLASFGKVIQPHKYPVESAMASYLIGDSLWGIAGLTEKNGISRSKLASGTLSLASDINGLMSKEVSEFTENPYQQGSLRYYIQKLDNVRHQPVVGIFITQCLQ